MLRISRFATIHLVALLAGGCLDQRHELILLGQRFEEVKDERNVVEAPPRVFDLKKWTGDAGKIHSAGTGE
jgi:hypothetical protein